MTIVPAPSASARLFVILAMLSVLAVLTGIGSAHADPNALWTIVHDQCVPHEQQAGDPAPCAAVAGPYAVLKDLDGAIQFLAIPTARVTGIESPDLLAPDAPNYFADAWHSRNFVDERAGRSLPPDWISLAVNSAYARSQDQLHIHIDCLRADVHDALTQHASGIGPSWTPFPVPLAGDDYSAIAIGDLTVNPFDLLADGIPGARDDMARQTLVVVGGRSGFVVLAGQGSGEDLQDHDVCAAPKVGK